MIPLKFFIPLAIFAASAVEASRPIKNMLAKVDFDVTPDYPKECTQFSTDSCEGARILEKHTMWHQRRLLMDRLRSSGVQMDEDYKSGFIEQDFDHFTPDRESLNGGKKWRQRFYYANDDAGVVSEVNFLILGGEGAICEEHASSWLSASAASIWSREMDTTLYLLEHRFYGDSNLTDTDAICATTDGKVGMYCDMNSLLLLTAEQALADAAVFIHSINREKNLTRPKWVVFGGSYPGNLAAWMRQKYPELVEGAVASSAPVQAKVDFFEYFQTVEKAFQFYAPAGCAIKLVKFFALAEKLISTPEGKQRLGICDEKALAPLDEQLYFGGLFSDAVQNDDPGHARIANECYAFEESLKHLEGHGETDDTEAQCNSLDFTREVKCYRSHPADYYWTWQTCNEFGYFQTSELGKSIYSVSRDAFPVSFYGAICEQLFGTAYNLSRVQQSVDVINEEYGGADKFNATNVVFINGSEDPWHKLSILDDGKFPGVRTMLIPGASHCNDFFVSSEPGVIKAQELAKEELNKWLK